MNINSAQFKFIFGGNERKQYNDVQHMYQHVSRPSQEKAHKFQSKIIAEE